MNTTKNISKEILRSDIKEAAKLSKISLSETEEALAVTHFKQLLEYAEILNYVDSVETISEKSDALSINALRCDFPIESLPREMLLKNTSETENGLISVPKFLDT